MGGLSPSPSTTLLFEILLPTLAAPTYHTTSDHQHSCLGTACAGVLLYLTVKSLGRRAQETDNRPAASATAKRIPTAALRVREQVRATSRVALACQLAQLACLKIGFG